MTDFPLTPEARRWAIGELARRAGVSDKFLASWRITFSADEVVVHLQPGSEKQIRFPALSPERWRDVCAGAHRTSRMGWMRVAGALATDVPDFPVPFCGDPALHGRPLFAPVEADTVACPLDLPASVLFNLCRLEEYNTDRDAHRRVRAQSLVACRENFFDRPIVDEYGFALQQALEYLLPGWRPQERRFRVLLSHDIDEVGSRFTRWPQTWEDTGSPVRLAWMAMPTPFRAAVQQTLHHRNPGGTLREFGRALSGRGWSPLAAVRLLARLSAEHQLHSAFYWKASSLSPYDSGYDPRAPAIRSVIAEVRALGFENGLHAGYNTYLHAARLAEEADIVREAIGEHSLGGRQHYLRWSPGTWMHWERCGLAYDSTVGCAERAGFRAGTCIPYHPWFGRENRAAELLEIPLLVMDVTLSEYMKLPPDRSFALVQDFVARCRSVGGVFTFLCHNDSLREVGVLQFYRNVLRLLAGSGRFDARAARKHPLAHVSA